MDTSTNHTTAARSRLERPVDGRVLAGVAAGIAERTRTAPWAIRLGFIIAAFFGGLGILAYLAGWILIPAEDENESPAERWLTDLGTPGKRAGALLIAIAVLVILSGLAPAAVLVAIGLLVAGVLLVRDGKAAES